MAPRFTRSFNHAQAGRLISSLIRRAVCYVCAMQKEMNEISMLFQRGALDKALAKCDQLVEAHPRDDKIRYAQGMIRQRTGDYEGAVESYKATVDIAPRHLLALVNLGGILYAGGRPSEAVEPLQRAVAIDPANHPARSNLAHALFAIGRFDEALAEVELALEQESDSFELHRLHLQINDRLDRFDASILSARRMITLKPEEPEGYRFLSANLRSLGRFDDAQKVVEDGLKCAPDDVELLAGLSWVKRDAGEEAETLTALNKVLSSGSLDQKALITAEFARATLLDRSGQIDEAFASLKRANDLKNGLESYNRSRAEKILTDNKALFTAEFFEERNGWGDSDLEPVFVIGMPRSGSTLVEQILSGHSGARGIGERDIFELLCNPSLSLDDYYSGYRERVSGLTDDAAKAYAAQYRTLVGAESHVGGSPVDKSLSNFNAIGLINLVFPRARIIFCRRHPLDICLSNYQQNYMPGLVTFSYNFDHLIHAFRICHETVSHFDEVLPGKIQVVDYENLVAEPDEAKEKVFALAGLIDDGQSTDHTLGEQGVRTASIWQVRQPIYQSSAQRWRQYEKHLTPLIEGLSEYLPTDA